MSFDFDRETGVSALGGGRYRSRLDRSWWVHRGPNGGYLAAIVLRALTETVDDPDRPPRSLTIHYATPPEGDEPLEIATAIERAGRSLSSCSARLTQGERLVGLALAAFSKARPGPEFCDVEPPPARRVEECVPPPRPVEEQDFAPPIATRWDSRWAIGSPPGSGAPEAVAGGWIRLPEGHVVDHVVAAAITDAWIPPVFSRVEAPIVVPTVDLTIHFRTALPLPGARADDFVLAVFRTRVAAEGFLEEDGEVWSDDGVLLAQSRQLAAVMPRPFPS